MKRICRKGKNLQKNFRFCILLLTGMIAPHYMPFSKIYYDFLTFFHFQWNNPPFSIVYIYEVTIT